MRSKIKSPQLAVLTLAVCACFAVPSRAEVSPAAARLFARAADVYGGARSLTLDYRVTSNNPALPAGESGRIWWSRPALFAQSWTCGADTSHVGADDKQIYFTDIDGVTGRCNWTGEFGFWTSLPSRLPGNLEFLLRGQKIPLGQASVRLLKPQKLEGVLCDGALLDLRRVNGDTIRFWFARDSGWLKRESWAVALPDSDEIAQVQTRYFNIVINPKLERSDFVRAVEEAAPMVEPRNHLLSHLPTKNAPPKGAKPTRSARGKLNSARLAGSVREHAMADAMSNNRTGQKRYLCSAATGLIPYFLSHCHGRKASSRFHERMDATK